jgi:hypothetical protein
LSTDSLLRSTLALGSLGGGDQSTLVIYGDGISQIDMDSGYKFHEFKSREEDWGRREKETGILEPGSPDPT